MAHGAVCRFGSQILVETTMKLLLLQDVENLGEEGDIVTVKDGFGRNYLIPQRLATVASDGIVRHRKEIQRQRSRRVAKEREDAESLKKELESARVVVAAKVGEGNRIFGTVTSQQVAMELGKQGFDVDRKDIDIAEDIRVTGVYTATVQVFKDLEARVTIEVISEAGAES